MKAAKDGDVRRNYTKVRSVEFEQDWDGKAGDFLRRAAALLDELDHKGKRVVSIDGSEEYVTVIYADDYERVS